MELSRNLDDFLPPNVLMKNRLLGKGGLGSTKFVAFETLAWHNECFFCAICKDSMVGKGFIQVIVFSISY